MIGRRVFKYEIERYRTPGLICVWSLRVSIIEGLLLSPNK